MIRREVVTGSALEQALLALPARLPLDAPNREPLDLTLIAWPRDEAARRFAPRYAESDASRSV